MKRLLNKIKFNFLEDITSEKKPIKKPFQNKLKGFLVIL